MAELEKASVNKEIGAMDKLHEIVSLAQNNVLKGFMIIMFAVGLTPGQLYAGENDVKTIYDFTVKDIDGKEVSLSAYKGKVMLIVNVASKCGHTPQYQELQSLYDRYKDRGLVILGFPANNFLWQEPGTDAEIKQFCQRNYGVTFNIFSKISVRGSDQSPFYKFLTSPETNPKFAGKVKWNFQKYLIGKTGAIVGRFAPETKPLSDEIIAAVEAELE